jgi:hypothetical protein
LSLETIPLDSAGQTGAADRAKLSTRSLALLIFCAAFLVYAFATRRVLDWMAIPQGVETMHIAQSLALTGRFAGAFSPVPSANTPYTAHLAPVYPAFVALILRVFGTGLASLTVLWAANLLFLSIQLALLPVLSERLDLGRQTGLVAAALGILLVPYAIDLEWEPLLAGMEIVILSILFLAAFQKPRSRAAYVGLGLLWGVALLTNPLAVILLVIWIATMLASAKPRARRALLATAVLVCVGAAATCAPWIVRNRMRLGGFFFVRNGIGLFLNVSNNDCAEPSLLASLRSGCDATTHPNLNPALGAEVARLGEVRFDRQQLGQAVAWIAAHPRRFAWLTAQRIALFWFPGKGASTLRQSAWRVWILTLLSVAGIVRLWRRNGAATRILVWPLLFYPLIYYVMEFEPRYRDPILWITLLLAAYATLDILPARLRRSFS